MKNPNSSTERLGFFCRPNHIRVKTPHGTRLTAHRSIGAALHTLDHQFSKSDDTKTSYPDTNPTRGQKASQGGLGLRVSPRPTRSPRPRSPSPLPPPLPPGSPPKYASSPCSLKSSPDNCSRTPAPAPSGTSTTVRITAVPTAANATVAITASACTPSCARFPASQPSPPAGLASLVANTPVSSAPVIPPIP